MPSRAQSCRRDGFLIMTLAAQRFGAAGARTGRSPAPDLAQDGGILPAVLFPGEPALGLDRSRAAHARGGDGLAGEMIHAVPPDIHPGRLGLHLAVAPRPKVTLVVRVPPALERP